jgi:hypothetical protein
MRRKGRDREEEESLLPKDLFSSSVHAVTHTHTHTHKLTYKLTHIHTIHT